MDLINIKNDFILNNYSVLFFDDSFYINIPPLIKNYETKDDNTDKENFTVKIDINLLLEHIIKKLDINIFHYIEDILILSIPAVFSDLSANIYVKKEKNKIGIEKTELIYQTEWNDEILTDKNIDEYIDYIYSLLIEEDMDASSIGYTEEQIRKILLKTVQEVQNFIPKIEKFYKDMLENNFLNNSKYKKEYFLTVKIKDILINNFIGFLKDLKKYKKERDFFFKVSNGSFYFPFIDQEKNFNTLNIMLFLINKYKNILNINDEILKKMNKKILYYTDFESNFLKKYKNFARTEISIFDDDIVSYISECSNCRIFSLPFFYEDSINLYKPVKKDKKYEFFFTEFIKDISQEKFLYFLDILIDKDGNTQKEIIKYVNSRLFEEYFNNDEFKRYFDEQLKDKFIKSTYMYAPVFPLEFSVFFISLKVKTLGDESIYTFKMQKNKEYKFPTFNLKKEDVNEIKKEIQKTLLKNNDKDNKKLIKFLKSEYIKPLSLCKNPVKEKKKLFYQISFFEKYINKEKKQIDIEKNLKK